MHSCEVNQLSLMPGLQDFHRGSLYGLEKFWAFHHYCALPKDQDVQMEPRLKVGCVE